MSTLHSDEDTTNSDDANDDLYKYDTVIPEEKSKRKHWRRLPPLSPYFTNYQTLAALPQTHDPLVAAASCNNSDLCMCVLLFEICVCVLCNILRTLPFFNSMCRFYHKTLLRTMDSS